MEQLNVLRGVAVNGSNLFICSSHFKGKNDGHNGNDRSNTFRVFKF